MKDDVIRFLKYNTVGVLNTAIDFVVYNVLYYFGMPIFMAQILSYCCGLLNSLMFNSHWTFKDKNMNAVKIAKFIMVTLVSLLISMIVLYACKAYGIEGFFAKIISAPFSMIINFFGSRLFVFNVEKQ